MPKSVAFEVNLDDAANGAAVAPREPEKKSLPRRLLERLQEGHTSPEQKAKQLLEKQRKAEQRRLQVLDERQSKARASISNPKGPHERTESRFGDRNEEQDEDDERQRTPSESPERKEAKR